MNDKDIKTIEGLLRHSESTLLDEEALAIENLLKENKQLEEDNKRLYEREKYLEQRRADIINKFQNEVTDTTIPVAKIEEKMKEVNESNGYSPVNKIMIEQVINEILEGK
jgi:lysyl-tRNA synthetase class II